MPNLSSKIKEFLEKLNFLKKEEFIFDISDEKIKVLKISGKNIEKKEFELEPDIIKNGYIKDSFKLENFLNQIKNSLKIKKNKIVKAYINLDSSEFFATSALLPDLPKKDLQEAIKTNIKDFVPFSLEEIYLNYKIYSLEEETKKREVSIFIIRKKLVDDLFFIFSKNNILPLFVGIDSFNLAFLILKKIILNAQRSYLFLFSKEERITLIFIKNLQIKIIWSHSIKESKIKDVISAFSKHLFINIKDEPEEILVYCPDNLKDEIKESLEENFKEKEIKFPEFLKEEWFVADELSKEVKNFPYLSFLNFISEFPEKEYMLIKAKEQINILILPTIALIFIINLSLYLLSNYSENFLKNIKSQMFSIPAGVENKYNEMINEVKRFNELLGKIEKAKSLKKFEYSKALNFLKKIPEDVNISKIEFNEKNIVIYASVPDLEKFNLFKKFLESEKDLIEKFDLPISKVQQLGNINFQVSIFFK
jgi:Tfp pilus assembly PilM family ATPase